MVDLGDQTCLRNRVFDSSQLGKKTRFLGKIVDLGDRACLRNRVFDSSVLGKKTRFLGKMVDLGDRACPRNRVFDSSVLGKKTRFLGKMVDLAVKDCLRNRVFDSTSISPDNEEGFLGANIVARTPNPGNWRFISIFSLMVAITLIVWILRGMAILSFIPGGIIWVLILFCVITGILSYLQETVC